jgi:hypothetical protein
MHGRIWFADNPWPDGHAVRAFLFQILLDESGPRLLLDLESEDYDAHDDLDADDGSVKGDWDSKDVWGNYHACSLSNVRWGVTPATAPLLLSPVDPRPDTIAVRADPVAADGTSPLCYDKHAFHIYLLGHDTVHDHDIRIRRSADGLYEASWSGLIALTYAGEDVFRHRFHAELHDVPFGGFRIENLNPTAIHHFVHPKPVPPTPEARQARARALAARFVRDADALSFHPSLGFAPDFLNVPT